MAEAGRLADREDEAEAAFRSLVATPDAAFLGYRGLLRQAIARADWPEAAALARLAEEAHPGAEWVRHERSQLAVRAHRWAEALDLVGATAPRAALGVGAAAAETDPAKAKRLARQAWEDDKSLTPAALAHAGHLRAEGKESRALTVIGETWALMPHPALAAFALAPVEDKLAQVQAAKRLIAKTPDHAESQFLLARVSLDAGLTGEARAHAQRAHVAGLNQRRLWLLLAEVEEEERGDTEAGRLALRDALRHAATAEANPAWQCEVCHAPHAVWEPACRSCATPGALRWGSAAGFKPTLTAIG